ncbi:MAG: hypothetical protein IH878_08315 [Gemmatimonadetes bacterium]|nr:hypothetical protein [Gemmatimonadota bacterium]
MQKGSHVVSVSLGTVAEPSGLVVLDPRTQFSEPDEEYDLEEVYSRRKAGYGRQRDSENYFNVTWIERFPAGRPIPAIVTRVAELISDKRLAKRCHLLLDITSTGAASCRVFESRGLHPTLIDLTNAGTEEHSGGVTRVPLRDVIGAAQVLVHTRRLQVADKLDLASTLAGDLLSCNPKPVTRGLDLRGGRNSDLVFALAIALWWADQHTWDYDPGPAPHRPVHTGPGGWMGM